MNLEKIKQELSSWDGVTVHPHRFGGQEFRSGSAEIGHVHIGGVVDIPFPRAIRDALLEEGLAEEYHWVPNSGWVTFRLKNPDDWKHALWLMRLSYLRYALKSADSPNALLEEESKRLPLSARFRTLLEPFAGKPVPAAAQALF